MPNLFDSWDLTPTPLPPRSRLYSLTPMGVGTPMVESLTGYLMRLAMAHSVAVGDLLRTEVRGWGSAKRPTGIRNAVNGVARQTRNLVDTVQHLTFRTDVACLSLLPFASFLPSTRLVRGSRAWCGHCYEAMVADCGVVYEPLLWCLQAVEVCARHKVWLRTICPKCARALPPLATTSSPGHCSRCGVWLGATASSQVDPGQREPTADLCWTAEAAGELLAWGPRVDPAGLRANLRTVLSSCVEELAGGNRFALSRVLQFPQTTFHSWVAGRQMPQLGSLLTLLRQLDLPVRCLVMPQTFRGLREDSV